MYKTIPCDSYDFGEPSISLIKLGRYGLGPNDRRALQKRAGAAFVDEIRKLAAAPGEVLAHNLALGATERWGCFPPGTTVRRGDAELAKIEDIKVGDEVVTHRGRPRRVEHRFVKHYDGDLLRIEVEGQMEDVECTPNHEFFVIRADQVACEIDSTNHCKPDTIQRQYMCSARRCPKTQINYQPEWIAAEDLKAGDYVLVPIPGRDVGKQAHNLSTPEARLFGYYMAEGSLIKDKDRKKGISLCFGSHELDTLVADARRQVAELDDGTRVNGPYVREDDHTAVLHVMSNGLASRFQALGGEYAPAKYLDGRMYAQHASALKHVLACYLAGDGTQPDRDGRITASTASKRLALDTQYLFSRLEIPISAGCFGPYEYEYSKPNSKPRHHISFSGRYLSSLADELPRFSVVEPKQLKAWSFVWNGYLVRPIRRITTRRYVGPVHNIEVAEDNSYTVGNGIAVHNSNRNGDGFKAAECRKNHGTFVKYGHAFRHHKNDDPAKSYGVIKLSHFNEAMHRIELAIAYNATKQAAERNGGLVADLEVEALEKDGGFPTSMATHVPFDSCSSCHNKARSRAEYCHGKMCKHGGLRDNLGKTFADGHTLHADNPHNRWFDLSLVKRGADRTSYTLGLVQKAASAVLSGRALDEDDLVLPDRLWLPGDDPLAYAKVAADLGLASVGSDIALAFSPSVQPALSEVPPIGDSIEKLAGVLRALADARVILPVREFVSLMTGDVKLAADAAPLVAPHVGRAYCDLVDDAAAPANPFRVSDRAAPTRAVAFASKVAADYGLGREHVSRRVTRAVIRGESPCPINVNQRTRPEKSASATRAIARQYALYKVAALQAMAASPDRDWIYRAAAAQDRVAS